MIILGAHRWQTVCALAALVLAPGCDAASVSDTPCEVSVGIQWVSDSEVVLHAESCAWTEGTEVTVKNHRMNIWVGVGVMVDADGGFTSEPFQAADDDLLEVIVAVPGDRSHRTCFLVAAEPITLPECPDP